jgi:pyrimidine-nucleoside phosphorylase
MRAVEIIEKKRDGLALSTDEINAFVQGYATGAIPDYQAAAWAMAVLLRGMDTREATDLTLAMVATGERLNLRPVGPVVVDKHSTGGVGDKTTLVVAPLVAAAGLPVAKMSGRGLGFSGGTLDKLEAIPGFTTALSLADFFRTVQRCGIVVAGQTADLVPADGKLYALRDVTGTVPSLPLIASSIMSKKIAGGADAVVLDVKCGHGAFMETVEAARELALLMIQIGQGVGLRVTAMLSDMNQPLGYAVGNANEVAEAIGALRGEGPADLVAHCLAVAAEMLVLGGVAASPEEATRTLRARLEGGQALEKLAQWIAAQGGDPAVIEDLSLLPDAPHVLVGEVAAGGAAEADAYVAAIDAREVAMAAVALGAGRERKEDAVDPGVGVWVRAKVGERVARGQPLLEVHARSAAQAETALARLRRAVVLSEGSTAPLPLFYDVLRG